MRTTRGVHAVAALVLASCGVAPGGPVDPSETSGFVWGSEVSNGADGGCTPDCSGRKCGPDGCGGNCGECASPAETCSSSGQCTSPTCSSSKDCPGTLVCDESAGACVVCVGSEDCEAGEECGADHDCHAVVVCASDKDCKDRGMVCNKAVGVCMECLKTEHCGPGEYCGSGYCLPMACASGEAKCEGNAVTVCEGDGSGWQVAQPCIDGQYCLDGTCLDLACQPFAIWCDGDVYKVCADDGTGIKYEEDCAAQGKHCFDAACIDTTCIPGQGFCANGNTAAICLADGVSYSISPCGEEQFCEDGACIAWECVPGSATCQGTVARVCDALGKGFSSQVDCYDQEQYCVDGECMDPQCEPNQSFCLDDQTVGHCWEDGLSATSELCQPQQSCLDGSCVSWQCTPGAGTCNGNSATVCDPLGMGPLPGGIDCAASGQLCSKGLCFMCVPDCQGKQCGPDGCGGQCGACKPGEQCSNGICPSWGCGDLICAPAWGESCATCPADCCGECCSTHAQAGCANPAIMSCVCKLEPTCCSLAWAAKCVQKAVTTCGGCGCGPVCGDKQCGYDGCYGTCGDCAANEICLDGWCKSLGLKWISLPGGTYQMGCSPGDAACSSHELPAHNVTVFGFDILETEVTAAQYDAVMIGKVDVPAPSCDAGGGPFAPVECVTWEEAKAFCQAVDPKGRLCTEAEWEYAARGETTTKYYCGDTAACLDDIAWFKTNSGDHKHDVKSGSKQPNSFGLYDMLGNVWEWTADCWHEDYDANDDGIGDWTAGYPEWSSDCSGNVRVKRGCSFLNDELNCRVSSRNYDSPNNYFGSLGVRCCRDQ